MALRKLDLAENLLSSIPGDYIAGLQKLQRLGLKVDDDDDVVVAEVVVSNICVASLSCLTVMKIVRDSLRNSFSWQPPPWGMWLLVTTNRLLQCLSHPPLPPPPPPSLNNQANKLASLPETINVWQVNTETDSSFYT